MKSVVSALKHWVTSQKSDWNQNDPTAANFVKNRPFYESIELLFDQRVEFTEGMYSQSELLPISVGDVVKVTWDGVEYKCVALDASAIGATGALLVGNFPPLTGVDTGEPFAIAIIPGQGMDILDTSEEGVSGANVKIEGIVAHTIDPKFLPDGIGGGGIEIVTVAETSTYATAPQQASMTLTEIAKAIYAGKTVFFQPYDGLLLPVAFNHRLNDLVTGVAAIDTVEDPYIMFGAISEDGTFYYRIIDINGYIHGNSIDFKEKQTITVVINKSGTSYTSSHTFSDLQQALMARKHVMATYRTEYYQVWSYLSGNSITFGRYDGTTMEKFTINSSNSVSYTTT